jgi:carbon-monoxide dehydrogenase medium subunit
VTDINHGRFYDFFSITPYTLLVAEDVEEAIEGLSRYGTKTKILAGGTDLIPQLKVGDILPEHIVDISRIPALRTIKIDGDSILVGAMVTHAEVLDSPLSQEIPLLADSCKNIGSPQIRNMGTVCGNIANASPAADCAPALMVLKASVKAASRDGDRMISVNDFFIGNRMSVLDENEVVLEISVPIPSPSFQFRFFKLGRRDALSCSIVNGAVGVVLNADRKIEDIRIVLGAVSATPIRLENLERELIGQAFNTDLVEHASRRASELVRPIDDVRASARYRREMVYAMLKDKLNEIDDNRHFEEN